MRGEVACEARWDDAGWWFPSPSLWVLSLDAARLRMRKRPMPRASVAPEAWGLDVAISQSAKLAPASVAAAARLRAAGAAALFAALDRAGLRGHELDRAAARHSTSRAWDRGDIHPIFGVDPGPDPKPIPGPSRAIWARPGAYRDPIRGASGPSPGPRIQPRPMGGASVHSHRSANHFAALGAVGHPSAAAVARSAARARASAACGGSRAAPRDDRPPRHRRDPWRLRPR